MDIIFVEENLENVLENSFSEALASYWLLTLYITCFLTMNISSPHWNAAACICKERLWQKVTSEGYPWNKINITFTWLSSLYIPSKVMWLLLTVNKFDAFKSWNIFSHKDFSRILNCVIYRSVIWIKCRNNGKT